MTDDRPRNPEILKHVKQLENQNYRLRRLLSTTLDVANEDVARASALQNESTNLEKNVDNLEKEKKDLEVLLAAVLANDDGNVSMTLIKLEREHKQLRSQLDEALVKIRKENEEMENLKSEDFFLKNTIAQLESTKRSLLDRIKMIDAKESVLSAISGELKRQLSQVEEREAVAIAQTGRNSDDTLPPDFKTVEEAFRTYVGALRHKLSEDGRSTSSETSDRKIADLESTKNKLYDDLERVVRISSREVDRIRAESSDPRIEGLIREMDVQKTVLLYNLKIVKLEEGRRTPIGKSLSCANAPSMSETTSVEAGVSHSENVIGAERAVDRDFKVDSLTRSLETKIADLMERYSVASEERYDETTTCDDQRVSLDRMVSQLEEERSALLQRLRTVSGTTAGEFERRMLQTRDELHDTFMREVSSEDVAEEKNYDDATNQLYVGEEARLEQRIRELEVENDRIKIELDYILKQLHAEQEMVQTPDVQQMLRQGIEELERQMSDTTERDV